MWETIQAGSDMIQVDMIQVLNQAGSDDPIQIHSPAIFGSGVVQVGRDFSGVLAVARLCKL